jgi:hypothetical protein
MNRLKFLVVLTTAVLGATTLVAQAKKQKKARPSPPQTVTANIDGNEVKIAYSRPGEKNPKGGEIRKIWGGLVPYGKVWRLGANEATLLTTEQPIVLGGHSLEAGTYSLFMVPEESGTSKLVINKKTGQWGIPYKEDEEKANELARVDLKKSATSSNVDPFTITIERTGAGAGLIRMAWENTQYTIAFKNK